MRYHSSLTKQYISIKDAPENIAKHLILKTCEVEESIVRTIPQDVVIGKVTATSKHPQADKLMICQVDCGAKGKFQICTGGENVVADSFVPVAIPGCYLPVIDLKIEPRKLRGEDSNGMICSKGEVGINEDEEQHWIRTLQYGPSVPAEQRVQLADFDDLTDADCGTPLGQKYPWLERYIFDVDNKTVTHRPDLTGHFGLAWELNAIYGLHAADRIAWNALPKLMHDHTHTSFAEMTAHAQQHAIPQHISCAGVQVYSTILLEGCAVTRSSLLTRMILTDCGASPKNNWVDFSQYVMLLTGQPIHTFDADTIQGSIEVRYAKDGEQFTDLKGVTHSLLASDIVIADSAGVLALGGVMGGQRSMVTDSTSRILIEVAHFDAVTVRKTGTRLGLRTDAELRYEKNINPHYSMHAVTMVLDALTYMRPDLGSYTISGLQTYTSGELRMEPKRFYVIPTEISAAITGDTTTITPATIQTILSGLGFGVLEGDVSLNTEAQDSTTQVTHDTMHVTVPRRRSPADINGQHDIVEEIVRVYGYENVVAQPCLSAMRVPRRDPHVVAIRAIEDALIGTDHYDQCESYPWLHSSMIELLGIETDGLYQLQNPLAPETQYLRDSMLPGLLDIVQKNMKFHDTLRIADIGKIRRDQREEIVAGIIAYTVDVKERHDDPRMHVCQDMMHALRAQGITGNIEWKLSDEAYLHSKKQAHLLVDNVVVGRVGQIHPRVQDALKLPERAGVVRGEIKVVPNGLHGEKQSATMQATQPRTNQDHIITRDVCFVSDISKTRSELMNALEGVSDIQNIRIFDIYAGDKLPTGKKSLACRYDVIFPQAPTSEQITDVMQRVIAAGESTGAVLR